MYGQVRQVVANRFGVDLRLRAFLLADEVLEEAARPIRVATLGAIGVVPGSDAQPQLLQRDRRRSAGPDPPTVRPMPGARGTAVPSGRSRERRSGEPTGASGGTRRTCLLYTSP